MNRVGMFGAGVINVQQDKFPEFRARLEERAALKKSKRWTAYRAMVRKVADGGELTSSEVDALEELAREHKFDPVEGFMTDVEKLQRYARLTEAVSNYERDSAKLEGEMIFQTSEIARLRDALFKANEAHVNADAQLRALVDQKNDLRRLVSTNPRLFDINPSQEN